jgi:hypothetical protein
MPSTHATLAPSSAERWLSCPGWDWPAMVEHIAGYVNLVLERASLYPLANVLVEQRLFTGVPECWGTSDIVVVSPVHVEVIDLKYGQGHYVEVVSNPQLRLYALGALATYGDVLGDTETVRATVYQPRMGNVATEELTAVELRAWRDEVALPAAELALGEDAPFGPSEEACIWCPAAGNCRAQMEWATQRDFGRPADTLTPEELAEALALAPAIKAWLGAVEAAALDRAYSHQQPIPGWKVVMSGGKRVVTDCEESRDKLEEVGVDLTDVLTQPVLAGIGALEKAVRAVKPKTDGRATRLEDVLGTYVSKTPGRPSLVPESDNRPTVSPTTEAAKEFSDVDAS